ncbi:MAG: hypothetical protein P8188_19600, partial [Gemmatimonadota bacterium]
MNFLDPSVPITTCKASSCAGCNVADTLHCHFSREDLVHFYLICMPGFLVGGAGILAYGVVVPLMCQHGGQLEFGVRQPRDRLFPFAP